MAKTAKQFKTMPDLIRMALICAIRDREGYAEADPGEWGKKAAAQAREMRAYLKRRFYMDTPDRSIDDVPLVDIRDIEPTA